MQTARCEVMALPCSGPGSTWQPTASMPSRQASDAAMPCSKLPDTLRGQISSLCHGLDQRDGRPGLGKAASPSQAADVVTDADSPTGADATGAPCSVLGVCRLVIDLT